MELERPQITIYAKMMQQYENTLTIFDTSFHGNNGYAKATQYHVITYIACAAFLQFHLTRN
jgi:hypothetical protein